MTPIQINSSRCIVCKWILWLDATEHLQLILSERNDSIPLIRLLCSHFQPCQTCSFVLGFIPALGEPAWVLPQLVHAHWSQGPGWLDCLALNDFLCGLGWILGQEWYHEETDQMPKVSWPEWSLNICFWPSWRLLKAATAAHTSRHLMFCCSKAICRLLCVLHDSMLLLIAWAVIQLSINMWEKASRLPGDDAWSSHYGSVETRSPVWLIYIPLRCIPLNRRVNFLPEKPYRLLSYHRLIFHLHFKYCQCLFKEMHHEMN